MHRIIKAVLFYLVLSLISDDIECRRRNRGHRSQKTTATTTTTNTSYITTSVPTTSTSSPLAATTTARTSAPSSGSPSMNRGVAMVPHGNYTFSDDTDLTIANDTLSHHLMRTGFPDISQIDWNARKDQEMIMRKFMIQTEIIWRLGLNRQPNTMMLDRLSPDQKRNMRMWYSTTQTHEGNPFEDDNTYAKHFQFIKSACHPPRKSWVNFFDNRRNLRLHFPMDVEIRRGVERVTMIASANLHLYKKALPSHLRLSEMIPARKCPPASCREALSRDHAVKAHTTRVLRHRRRQYSREKRSASKPEANNDRRLFSDVRRRLPRRQDIADERYTDRLQTDRRTRATNSEDHAEDGNDETATLLDNDDDDIIVSVYRYQKRRARMHLLSSHMVAKNFIGKMTFNITSTVAMWMQEPRKNIGLEIRVENMHGQWVNPYDVFHLRNCSINNTKTENMTTIGGKAAYPLNLTEVRSRNSTDGAMPNLTQLIMQDSLSPMIYLETTERPVEEDNSRQKRNANYKSTCVREPLYVSFKDLGWGNRIIMPQGFETGYCVGTCSHMSLKKSYHKQQLECCGPTRLKPLTVLHLDKKGRKVGISVFDSFIIDECGCRR